jgi:carbamate kinase
MVERGSVPAGSMGPKLSSAVNFAQATGRTARICHLNRIEAAITGTAGTIVERDQR